MQKLPPYRNQSIESRFFMIATLAFNELRCQNLRINKDESLSNIWRHYSVTEELLGHHISLLTKSSSYRSDVSIIYEKKLSKFIFFITSTRNLILVFARLVNIFGEKWQGGRKYRRNMSQIYEYFRGFGVRKFEICSITSWKVIWEICFPYWKIWKVRVCRNYYFRKGFAFHFTFCKMLRRHNLS